MDLVVSTIGRVELGKKNLVYLAEEDYKKLRIDNSHPLVVIDRRYVFRCSVSSDTNRNTISLSKIQREYLNKSEKSGRCHLRAYPHASCTPIGLMRLSVDILNNESIEVSAREFSSSLRAVYNNFPFNIAQELYFFNGDIGYRLKVAELLALDEGESGLLVDDTEIYMTSRSKSLTFVDLNDENVLLDSDFNYERLGIGGLRKEFSLLFRRAFVQRVFNTEVIQRLGIMHVKGIMLYGPPGTGKTLIARQIGSLLNARPPKVVNGPEILNKYVGQSEENIRNLFKDAEEEYALKKDKSLLHIIIFDEIDAICKSRGMSSSSGIGDQIVNQLLSKMDGVEALDNVLIIGMTNRIDLIDSALLRPGRFEICLEISLPDEHSRYEILRIHTKKMVQSKFMEEDVDLREIARLTRNYTGAEISAVVKSAVSYALERKIQSERESGKIKAVDQEDIKVKMKDFVNALGEVSPAFGFNEEDFENFNRIFYELPAFTDAIDIGCSFMRKLVQTNLYSTSSILFYGRPGAGKTTISVKVALKSSFPLVKMISPKDVVGLSEYEKVKYIKDGFSDAYKSTESVIILDDIETLIEYVDIGPRFSNAILQALKIFVKREEKNKLFIIGTTSSPNVMNDTGIYECFYGHCEIPMLTHEDYVKLCEQNSNFRSVEHGSPCVIKKLLLGLDQPDVSTH